MTLETSEHLASPKLLRKIDELREKNVGQHVPLPQLVVVGDQSSGKSSLLENLTGIPFPRDLDLCTRYATQITSRRDPEATVHVTIIPGPHSSDEHRDELKKYQPPGLSPSGFRAQFPEMLKEINRRMGIRMDKSTTEGTVFSQDVLKIEISGPEEDYLTLIDVPGIFRTPTEGLTTKKDVVLVKNMVTEYIKDSRTVILAVLPSNVDPATQEILTLAEDYDKNGERTLGVLTKPDLVTEHSAKVAVCNVVLGKKKPLTLGYYVVRNRGSDSTGSFDRGSVEEMFNEEPWDALPKNRVGVKALKARLGELLGQITRKEFPTLRRDIKKQLTECEEVLKGLGIARQTEQEQRRYLSGLSRDFQELIHNALNAHYFHAAFDDHPEFRLITRIVNLTEKFNEEFAQKAHLRYFEDASESDSGEGDIEELEPVDDEGEDNDTKEDKNDGVDEDEDNVKDLFLEDVITTEHEFELPKEGITDWITKLYLGYRGAELGNFGGTILSGAFREQSSKWKDMTESYVSRVIIAIQQFISIALDELCTDETVRRDLWSAIIDQLRDRYKKAMKRARFLVSIEYNQRPYTLDHCFNDNLQKARGKRNQYMLENKARQELKRDTHGYAVPSNNLVVDLKDVMTATTDMSNTEHVTQEIHDILRAYYKIARKRFVDNIYQQVVDHFLLTGPKSPLRVFSQEWVLELSVEQLDSIAGELPMVKEQRDRLKKKIADLKDAMQVLRF